MINRSGILSLLFVGVSLCACQGQRNGSRGAGNESVYSPLTKTLDATDTSAAWFEEGRKILLTGIVYERDGKTPAPGVVLYYYHTNADGRYIHKPSESRSMPPNERGQTHGYIRGWVKTDSLGKYFIYTAIPGAYPTDDEPAHIHVTVKEPGDIDEYYIDDYVFDDDELLTSARRRAMENRGGSGVLRLVQADDLLVGERNIFLGLNVPDYPVETGGVTGAGVDEGEDVPSFIPYHAWGPDKGTRTCPVCKYGWYHGILYFVGDNPDWKEIKAWLLFLENENRRRAQYLKVYFVYGNQEQFSQEDRTLELERIGQELRLQMVALTFVPSFSDVDSDVALLGIDQDAVNTFVLFRRSRVIGRFTNLKPVEENFHLIRTRLDETVNEYFAIPPPEQGSR